MLLTSAGRRAYLVHHFRDAVGAGGRVIAADMAGEAPAVSEADGRYRVPPVTSPDYVDVIVSIVEREAVGLVVSLNDHELPVLAGAADRILAAGAVPVVSSPAVIETCFDKWGTHRWCRALGLETPRSVLGLEATREALARKALRFPLVVKPRWGTSSVGIEGVEGWRELTCAAALLEARHPELGPEGVLVQERLEGEEYGLDVVNDLHGHHVTTWPRRKLGMRAGETDRAVTVDSRGLRSIGSRIGSELGHVGNLDVDVFLTEEGFRVLEMNPRFGGGYPFSHAAGAHLPAALVAWARGESVRDEWLTVEAGLAFAKADRLVACHGGGVDGVAPAPEAPAPRGRETPEAFP